MGRVNESTLFPRPEPSRSWTVNIALASGAVLLIAVFAAHLHRIGELLRENAGSVPLEATALSFVMAALPLLIALLMFSRGKRLTGLAVSISSIWAMLLAIEADQEQLLLALGSMVVVLIAVWLPGSRRHVSRSRKAGPQ